MFFEDETFALNPLQYQFALAQYLNIAPKNHQVWHSQFDEIREEESARAGSRFCAGNSPWSSSDD